METSREGRRELCDFVLRVFFEVSKCYQMSAVMRHIQVQTFTTKFYLEKRSFGVCLQFHPRLLRKELNPAQWRRCLQKAGKTRSMEGEKNVLKE